MSRFYYEILELAHAADSSRIRRRNTQTRWANNAFALPPNKFLKRFRLTKELAQELIEELSPLIPSTRRSDGLDVETKVLITLQLVASNSYQTQVGDIKHLAVSQASVSKALHQVIAALNHPTIFNKYIKFPSTREERELIKRGFYSKFCIPGVLGCVDGTHVSILRPVEHEERFYNRKGYHSLNVMLLCDSDLRIMYVDPSYPGATHDSVVWLHSPVRAKLEELATNTNEQCFILGDSGYPLRRTLLTPILNAAEDTPEAYYTNVHVNTRNVVERCIGVLKARFRCLLAARMLHYSPTTAAQIINACCVLHNIVHEHNIYFQPLTEAELAEERRLTREARTAGGGGAAIDAGGAASDLRRGQQVRAALVSQLWASRPARPQ